VCRRLKWNCLQIFSLFVYVQQTCHFKDPGVPCRKTQGTCDLPEFCTGNSEYCPGDVHKLNGLKCESPSGQVSGLNSNNEYVWMDASGSCYL